MQAGKPLNPASYGLQPPAGLAMPVLGSMPTRTFPGAAGPAVAMPQYRPVQVVAPPLPAAVGHMSAPRAAVATPSNPPPQASAGMRVYASGPPATSAAPPQQAAPKLGHRPAPGPAAPKPAVSPGSQPREIHVPASKVKMEAVVRAAAPAPMDPSALSARTEVPMPPPDMSLRMAPAQALSARTETTVAPEAPSYTEAFESKKAVASEPKRTFEASAMEASMPRTPEKPVLAVPPAAQTDWTHLPSVATWARTPSKEVAAAARASQVVAKIIAPVQPAPAKTEAVVAPPAAKSKPVCGCIEGMRKLGQRKAKK